MLWHGARWLSLGGVWDYLLGAYPGVNRRGRKAKRRTTRLELESCEERSLLNGTVIASLTQDWSDNFTDAAVTVTSTVTADAPGYSGLYLWQFHVVNHSLTDPSPAGVFSFAMNAGANAGYAGSFSNVQNSLGWGGSAGLGGVGWGSTTIPLLPGASADFSFTTPATNIVATEAQLSSYSSDDIAVGAVLTPGAALPAVTITSINNAAEGSTTPGKFMLTRTGDTSQSLTVNYTVGGTATAGTDYAALGGSVVFLPGHSTAYMSVAAINDSVYDPNETVSVTVSSGTGYAPGSPASADLTISNWVNEPPVVTMPGDRTSPTNTPLVFSTGGGNAIVVTDIDAGTGVVEVGIQATGGTVTLGTTSGLTFSEGDGSADASATFTGTLSAVNAALNGLTLTPNSGYQGWASLSVTVNDLGNTGSGGEQIGDGGVWALFGDPVTALPDEVETEIDTAVDVDVLANDTALGIDVAALSLAINGAPTNGTATVNDNGTPGDIGDDYITYTPGAGFVGTDTFSYTLSDGSGNASTTTVTVSVRQPRYLGLAGVEDRSDFEGSSVHLTVTTTTTSPVTFTQTGLPPGLSIDPSTGVISGTVSYAAADANDGLYEVTVTGTDGTHTESISFIWVAQDSNRIAFIDDQVNSVGSSVSVATNPNGPAGLTYSATGLPAGLSINPVTGEIFGTVAAAASGYVTSVTVIATDGTSSDRRTFDWTVAVAPHVVFTINGTLSPSDDVAFVAPGRDTLTVRATLLAPGTSSPQHVRIQLDSDKSIILFNGNPVPNGVLELDLSDGGFVEFQLVAIAWSEDVDDVPLVAVLLQPGQPAQPAGGAKVMNLPPLYLNQNSPDPEGTVRAKQGEINDCWFVATVIGLARSRPNDIKSMITDNQDGTFTVVFPGAAKEKVVVNAKTLDVKKLAKSDGIWLAVLEQAYAQLKNGGRSAVTKKFFGVGQEIDFMGFTKATIKTLTGHSGDSDLLKDGGRIVTQAFVNKTAEKLNAALNPPAGQDKRVVTVLTRPTVKSFFDQVTSKIPINNNGLVSTHWYAVYAYNPTTKMVQLRNPWAELGEYGQTIDKQTGDVTTPDTDNDGLFWMSLNDFIKEFMLVTYEEKS